jgi:2-alkyl-3-oxoalkanoate reductase
VRVLVTGGGGFLGRAICAQLAESGYAVRTLNRSHPPPEFRGDAVTGDVRRRGDVDAAVEGCEAVIHCAARAGVWGCPAEYHQTNVVGTENVLAACTRHGVSRLVYTSSPSVVHNGADLEGVDESAPYATRFLAPYPKTKAIAEWLVLAANSPRLATVALRPHLIWGPGDPHFLPRFIDAARRGRLRLIGDASQRVDTVYVDNAAEAHVLALQRLTPGAPIAGRAYFITQGDPRPIGETINLLLAAAGLPAETRHVPEWPAWLLARTAEFVFRLARSRSEPPLTRFLFEQLTTAHWFDITAARRDLGYHPSVSTPQGLELLSAHLGKRDIPTAIGESQAKESPRE